MSNHQITDLWEISITPLYDTPEIEGKPFIIEAYDNEIDALKGRESLRLQEFTAEFEEHLIGISVELKQVDLSNSNKSTYTYPSETHYLKDIYTQELMEDIRKDEFELRHLYNLLNDNDRKIAYMDETFDDDLDLDEPNQGLDFEAHTPELTVHEIEQEAEYELLYERNETLYREIARVSDNLSEGYWLYQWAKAQPGKVLNPERYSEEKIKEQFFSALREDVYSRPGLTDEQLDQSADKIVQYWQKAPILRVIDFWGKFTLK